MDHDIQTLAGGDAVLVTTTLSGPNTPAEHADEPENHGAPLALDLRRLLIRQPSDTYLFRVKGHHWADQGVYDGDVAILDKAVQPKPYDLVVSWQDSGFTICRRHQLPETSEALGTVTAVVRKFR